MRLLSTDILDLFVFNFILTLLVGTLQHVRGTRLVDHVFEVTLETLSAEVVSTL